MNKPCDPKDSPGWMSDGQHYSITRRTVGFEHLNKRQHRHVSVLLAKLKGLQTLIEAKDIQTNKKWRIEQEAHAIGFALRVIQVTPCDDMKELPKLKCLEPS